MKKVISTENIPIKMWLEDIESGALDQAKNLANLPFVFKHIAIMPDAHQGYGMPIGGVMATNGVIIPNAVGKDIGCGMIAVKTSLTDIAKDDLKKIMNEIRKVIPLGFNKHKEKQNNLWMPCGYSECDLQIVSREYDNALISLGTLGGGNHFIEIQKGSDGHIWIMIHSGSRNLGSQVADHYDKLAIELNEKWFSSVPKKDQLAFLPIDTDEGQDYLNEMNYCVDFALANRKLMLSRIIKIIGNNTGFPGSESIRLVNEKIINIAHNYAAIENHFGKNVWVHRKGATRAYYGELGIIPGSQGSSSFIVEGLGNIESFKSCSHGAGRLMSRTKAKKELNLETEIKKLDDLGVVHSLRGISNLDEASGAYKDINEVMTNQNDLVKIKVELKPLAVIKG